MTLPYAEVIGDPIAHSKSPMIHKFWLERAGIEADYRATHVRPEELADFFTKRRSDSLWRGCNVTIPHKQAVIPLLDRLDPSAEKIGAVNTVRPENGLLVGYNTDFGGFLEPLRPLLDRHYLFRMARVIGTGGAARAVAQALWSAGFTIVIIGRNIEKARALRASFDPDDSLIGSLESFAEPTDFDWNDRTGCLDLVVNTTSLGMKGQPPLNIDFSHIPPGAILYDIVYAPLDTPLLIEGRKRGHRTIDGLAMLIGQAAEAFALFFGTAAPRDTDAKLRNKLCG